MDRRRFLKSLAKIGGAGFLLTAGGAYGGYHYVTQTEPQWPVVERVQIPLKNLNSTLDGFKIVQMSDLHLQPYTTIEFIQEAITITNTLQPDLVALTGDFVLEEAEAIFDLAPALTGLNPKYGIFTVLGNHDLWTNREVVQRGLEQQGIPVLTNRGQAIGVGRTSLYIAGVDDGWSGHPDLAAALAALPANTPTILLAHEPDLVDSFAPDGRVSLQLSGHSHGGQVRFPGVGPLILPHLGQKYDLGLYQVDHTWLYTNRGLGVIWPPVRFNCRPEITEITLIKSCC